MARIIENENDEEVTYTRRGKFTVVSADKGWGFSVVQDQVQFVEWSPAMSDYTPGSFNAYGYGGPKKMSELIEMVEDYITTKGA